MSETILDIPIYELVRGEQLQHGLKYDDHFQYRSYCSRKLHRIRRSLNLRQNIPSTAKARHQRARKLMDINGLMVTEAGDYSDRMLFIPLFLAERAWSYAMQLKEEVVENPRRRFHLMKRLKKAAEYGEKFEVLIVKELEGQCSERTKMEATAYASYLKGLYDLEREKWTEAKDNFKKSLLLLTTLSLSIQSEHMVEQYRLRMDELRASLRYCTFTLGEKPKEYKIKLPATLQFHDIAFKHEAKREPSESAGEEDAKMEGEDDDEEEYHQDQYRDEAEEEEEEEEEEDARFSTPPPEESDGGVTNLVKGWLGIR